MTTQFLQSAQNRQSYTFLTKAQVMNVSNLEPRLVVTVSDEGFITILLIPPNHLSCFVDVHFVKKEVRAVAELTRK